MAKNNVKTMKELMNDLTKPAEPLKTQNPKKKNTPKGKEHIRVHPSQRGCKNGR